MSRYSVLKMAAVGLISDTDYYSKLFDTWIRNNTDEDGNVLDENERAMQVQVLKEALEEMSAITAEEVIAELSEYEDMGKSEGYKKFLEMSVRFVVAVDGNPERVDEYTAHWLKFCKVGVELSLENMAKTYLKMVILNYLDGIEEENNEGTDS